MHNYVRSRWNLSIHPLVSAPSYCANCGKPYPWTAKAIQAALELAEEIEGLTDNDREILKQNAPNLFKDSPQTEVAATRFRKVLDKSAKVVGEAFRAVLVNVITEAAKKAVFPHG